MNKNSVLFVSKDENNASTRYRALDFFPGLAAMGWQARHLTAANSGNPSDKIELLRAAGTADVVVLQRRTFTGPVLWLLSKRSKHLVFDFDDAIFCRSNGAPSRIRQQRFAKTLASCDAAWAGNNYLAEHARTYCNAVAVLPTAVDCSRYKCTVEKPADTVDCVWIGSSSTRRYLDQLLPVLEDAHRLYPQLRLKVVADFAPNTANLPIEVIPWSDTTEASALASAHIGIAPMADNAWTAGKCGLKVIQYMAAGLPVITDNAGVNRELVEHGVSGLVAHSKQDWNAAIGQLVQDSTLRERMGQRGRDKAQSHYDRAIVCRQMAELLDNLVTGA
ncbi:MAG TPA: hypothetical protein DCZ13_14400 [Porticoccaceae bacterium]|nr:hypothetical protein [Porticoccaceae bacterium]